jgi:hypothetical protein
MLLLKKHLVRLVREGKKRQTIRLWARPVVRPGQVSYTPGLGRMRILSVDPVPTLDALTDADARADGFPDRTAPLAEIRTIYGNIPTAPGKSAAPPARTLFRITFDWPIDAAGRALVLAPDPPIPARSVHAPPPAVPKPPKKSARPAPRRSPAAPRPAPAAARRPMSAAERQALRGFVLARAPAA